MHSDRSYGKLIVHHFISVVVFLSLLAIPLMFGRYYTMMDMYVSYGCALCARYLCPKGVVHEEAVSNRRDHIPLTKLMK